MFVFNSLIQEYLIAYFTFSLYNPGLNKRDLFSISRSNNWTNYSPSYFFLKRPFSVLWKFKIHKRQEHSILCHLTIQKKFNIDPCTWVMLKKIIFLLKKCKPERRITVGYVLFVAGRGVQRGSKRSDEIFRGVRWRSWIPKLTQKGV